MRKVDKNGKPPMNPFRNRPNNFGSSNILDKDKLESQKVDIHKKFIDDMQFIINSN